MLQHEDSVFAVCCLLRSHDVCAYRNNGAIAGGFILLIVSLNINVECETVVGILLKLNGLEEREVLT